MIDMAFQDVLDSTGARRISGDLGVRLSGISTDTRTIQANELYLALSGPQFDGNAFIAQALERGAAGLLLRDDQGLEGLEDLPVPVAVHRSPRRALSELARWHRSRLRLPVIGITGSCGKTSTKDMLVQLLEPFFSVYGSPASFNNDIGVPRTVLGASSDTEVLVVEMGTNAPGEIAGLCRTARPTAGILTHVGSAHLEGLGSVQGVAREKSALIASLPPDGFCVLNADCRWSEQLAGMTSARAIRFGLSSKGSDLYASDVWFHGAGTTFRLHAAPGWGLNRSHEVTVPFLGLHMVQNLLAALAACAGLGLNLADLLGHLGSLRSSKRRLERREAGGITVYDDCYNANPDSAKASVRVLAGLHGHARRILVLGDMLELGEDAAKLHGEVGVAAAAAGLDLVVAVGEFAADIAGGAAQVKGAQPQIIQYATPEEAIEALPQEISAGDLVLVKASRGARLERLVERLLDTEASSMQG